MTKKIFIHFFVTKMYKNFFIFKCFGSFKINTSKTLIVPHSTLLNTQQHTKILLKNFLFD